MTAAADVARVQGPGPMSVRAFRWWLVNYRRTWRGSIFSSVLSPVMFLGAMGLGLGSLVDRHGTAHLGGLSYLAFLAPGLMQRLLKARQHDLAEYRGKTILNLAAQHCQPGPWFLVDLEQPLKCQHLAEDAGHLGCGQGRITLEITDGARKILVNAMPQLMSQGHNVSQFVGEIHQDIGMDARDGTAAEGAASLADTQLRVDPALVEKLTHD